MSNKSSAAPDHMGFLGVVELPTIAHSSGDDVVAGREQPKIGDTNLEQVSNFREEEAPTKPTS